MQVKTSDRNSRNGQFSPLGQEPSRTVLVTCWQSLLAIVGMFVWAKFLAKNDKRKTNILPTFQG